MADKTQEVQLEETEYIVSDTVTTPIGMYCRDLHTEYENSSYRKRKLDEIKEARKRYRNDRDAKNFPWPGSSNKSMGLEAIAVDNLEPRIVSKLIGEDNFIQCEPTGPEDVEAAPKTKQFLEWACLNNMKIKKPMRSVVHDLLIDGTKDVMCLWEEKDVISRTRGTMPVFQDQEGNRVNLPAGALQSGSPQEAQQLLQSLMQMGIMPAGSEEGHREQTSTEFKCQLEALKLEDCFFPDHGDRWEEQPFLRYIYPTLRELVDLQEAGIYKNISNDLVEGQRRQTTDDESAKDVDYSMYGQECQLLECYVKWDGEWALATFSPAAGWIEVRNQPLSDVYWHGRKPVRRFSIYPESNESMGTGVCKKIEQHSRGINDLYNQMIDNATIETLPYFFYNKSATGMETLDTKLFPGKGVGIPKDSNVYFPQAGVKSPVFIQFINLLLTFFERTLSLMDYSAGTRSSTTGAGGDTAAGMNMILQEGNIKHNYTGNQLQDIFADVLTDVLSIYAQYMPMDAQMRITDKDGWKFEDVDVMAIQGRFDLRIEVSDASANTMTNRNEKLTLAQVLSGNPTINLATLTDDVLKAFGIMSTEKYIKPEFQAVSQALAADPQGVMQVIQQHMQQFQAQQEEQKIKGQAEANIKRQKIERDVEAPFEDEKMVDQANEGYKRKIVGQVIEQMGGLPQ